tara:strand:- start:51 stop:479 length:429 start_codon:yes stop_codon:yes gene_type:complete
MVHSKSVSEDFIDLLFDIFKNNNDWDTDNITDKCLLTINVIDRIPLKFIKQIYDDYKQVHHLHILKYPEFGRLDWHDHFAFEEKSYIIYMDNVGGTFFKINDKLIFESSEKNKLVIFDSKLKHKAYNDNTIRFVAAGGIYKK